LSRALRKDELEHLFEAPPAPDWALAFEAVNTLKDLQRIVDRFDRETAVWIARMSQNLEHSSARLTALVKEFSPEVMGPAMVPILSDAIDVASEAIIEHEVPYHDRAEVKQAFDKLREVSGPAGRFLRKQLNHLEDVRVKRHNAVVDFYYALLGLRAEMEGKIEGGPSFDDPKALADYLHSQIT